MNSKIEIILNQHFGHNDINKSLAVELSSSNDTDLCRTIAQKYKYTEITPQINSCVEDIKKAKEANQIKNRINRQYNKIKTEIRSSVQKLNDIQSNNAAFSDIRDNFTSTLVKQIEDLDSAADKTINAIEWDRLIIAFFGVTNAGKSTITECFRIKYKEPTRIDGKDGLIVGDGRADFTQEKTEYNMLINKQRVTLIDVPGIEGNEAKYENQIKDALDKAHCVFYVHKPHQKPDEGTVKKINKYLKDWGTVYAIFNYAGSTENYDEEHERIQFRTDELKQDEKAIDQLFKETLGDRYKGIITIQALLAISALANFDNKLLQRIKDQKEFISYFGSREALLKFSDIDNLFEAVEQKTDNYKKEIAKFNFDKLTSLAKRTVDSINDTLSNQEKAINQYSERVNQFKSHIQYQFINNNATIKTKIETGTSEQLRLWKEDCIYYIDKEKEKKDFEALGSIYQDRIQENALIIAEKSRKELFNRISELQKHYSIPSRIFKNEYQKRHLEGTANYDNVVTHLGIDWGGYALNMGSLALTGATIGMLFSPIGAVIGGTVGTLLGYLKKLIFGNDQKNKAKKELNKVFDSDITPQKNKFIESVLKDYKADLSKLQNAIYNSIDTEKHNLESLNTAIDTTTKNINNIIKESL